jgi:REP element-mobilizing transposase RayT
VSPASSAAQPAARQSRISILNYAITSNHTHLLATSLQTKSISRFIQKLEGQFALYYNRTGADSAAAPSGADVFIAP